MPVDKAKQKKRPRKEDHHSVPNKNDDSAKKRKTSLLNSNSSRRPTQDVSPLSGETQFPRGGGTKLAPIEHKALIKKAEKESLFSSKAEAESKPAVPQKKLIRGKALKASGAKRAAAKKREDKLRYGSDGPDLFGTDKLVVDRLEQQKVEPLRFKKVNEGMLLLGMVKEVREAEALISLPNNLTGWVEVDEICDELNDIIEATLDDEDAEAPSISDFLTVGQTVRCVVLSAITVQGSDHASHKHITLSLKPSRVNMSLSLEGIHPGMVVYGAIASEEDRGYTVSFGTSALSGFLPFSNAPVATTTTGASKNSSSKKKLRVGQVMELLVDKVDAKRGTAILSAVGDQIAGAVTKDLDDLSLDSLQPGMLVHCTVCKVLDTGLLVSFLTSFVGTIHSSQFPNPSASAPAAAFKRSNDDSSGGNAHDGGAVGTNAGSGMAEFRPRQRVTARIIYVDIGAKACGLSMRPHVLARAAPAFTHAGITVGQRFPGATVVRVLPGLGLVLRLPLSCPADGGSGADGGGIVDVAAAAVPAGDAGRTKGRTAAARKAADDAAAGNGGDDATATAAAAGGEAGTGEAAAAGAAGTAGGVEEAVEAMVHISSVGDERVDRLEKVFSPGSAAPCRAVGFSWLDGLVCATMRPSDLAAALLCYEEAVPGTVYRGTVVKSAPYGCIVALSRGVRGLVPRAHLPAAEAARPERHLAPGKKVEVRVLEVRAAERRLTLTRRAALLRSPLPPLASWGDVRVGAVSHGCVLGPPRPNGVLVGFYGPVKGFVPRSEVGIDLDAGEDLTQCFPPGTVVKARVIKFDSERRRLRLSLNAAAGPEGGSDGDKGKSRGKGNKASVAADDSAEGGAKQKKGKVKGEVPPPAAVLSAGEVVRVRVMGRDHSSILVKTVTVDEGEAGAAGMSGARGMISEAHLSDYPSLSRALLDSIRVGTELEAVVLEPTAVEAAAGAAGATGDRRRAPAPRALLSLKPSLIAAARAGLLPTRAVDVRPGHVLHGYVTNVASFGIFVAFAGRVTALAHRSALADGGAHGAGHVDDPARLLAIGQSVRCRVVSVTVAAAATSDLGESSLVNGVVRGGGGGGGEDGEGGGQRIQVSLRPSACGDDGGAALRSFRHSAALLCDLRRAAAAAAAGAGSAPVTAMWPSVGTVVEGEVVAAGTEGVVMSIPGGLEGLLPPPAKMAAAAAAGKLLTDGSKNLRPGRRCAAIVVSPTVYPTSAEGDTDGEKEGASADVARSETAAGRRKMRVEVSMDPGLVRAGAEGRAQRLAARQELLHRLGGVTATVRVVTPDIILLTVTAAAASGSTSARGGNGGKKKSVAAAVAGGGTDVIAIAAAGDLRLRGAGETGRLVPGAVVQAKVCSAAASDNSAGLDLNDKDDDWPLMLTIDADPAGASADVDALTSSTATAPASATRKRKADDKTDLHATAGTADKKTLRRHGDPASAAADADTVEDLLGRLDAAGGGMAPGTAASAGALVQGVVKSIDAAGVHVLLGKDVIGYAHVTDLIDPDAAGDGDDDAIMPLSQYSYGQAVKCRLLAAAGASGSSKLIPLSLRPSEVAAGAARKMPPLGLRLTVETARAGHTVRCVVDQVRQDCIWLHVTHALRGRVRALDAAPVDLDILRDLRIGPWARGQVVKCRVLSSSTEGRRGAAPYLELAIDAVSPVAPTASALSEGKKKKKISASTQDEEAGSGVGVSVGQLVPARVVKILPGAGYLVRLGGGRVGRVHICDVADAPAKDPLAVHAVDSYVIARVVAADGDRIDLSLRPSAVGTGAAATAPPPGPPPAVDSAGGRNTEAVADGVKGDKEADDAIADAVGKMPDFAAVGELAAGQLVCGYVKSVSAAGCFVHLSRAVTGWVGLSQLSDRFVRDVKGAFPPGKLVTARVLGVDAARGTVQLSLRRSALRATRRILFSDLSVGQIVKGTVKAVKPFGIFVQLRKSDLSGLCHVSEVSETFVKDLTKEFSVGEAVRACILKLDAAGQKISLGMKDRYFEGAASAGADDESDDDSDKTGSEDEEGGARRKRKAAVAGNDEDEDEDDDESADSDDLQDHVDEQESDEDGNGTNDDDDADDDDIVDGAGSEDQAEENVGLQASAASRSVGTMELDIGSEGGGLPSFGFEWDGFSARADAGGEDDGGNSDSDGGGEEDGTRVSGGGDEKSGGKSKDKRRKKREKEESERRIREQEAALADGGKAPETAAEFERLVLASPHSSYVWIKYIAYHLDLAEPDRAREVAERALKAVGFREEQERFNVWVARLNLESMYGTREQLLQVFEEACRACDAKKMHLQLLSIFEKGGDAQVTEQFFRTITRKYAASVKVWLRYCLFKLRGAHPEAAGRALERAVAAVPKRKHVKLISRFGMLEYRQGCAERGRTVMEGVVAAYPKRIDLWSVYVDLELKAGNIDGARRLLQRAVTLKLRARQAKFFFKRWLELERAHGNEASVASVKEAARQWVETNATA